MTAPLELVRIADDVGAREIASGVTIADVGPRVEGSPLSMGLIQFTESATVDLSDPGVDQLLVVTSGVAQAAINGEVFDLASNTVIRISAKERCQITADAGTHVLQCLADATADEHAPLGEPERVAVADLHDPLKATSSRQYQILFGPENGYTRATLFLGEVPPGAAPWHFHQYEELMWLHSGATVFHQSGGSQAMNPGSVVRIRARAPHVNQNPTADNAYVIGFITPASSPSAAYLSSPPEGCSPITSD